MSGERQRDTSDGRGTFYRQRSSAVRRGGVYRSENVGMSNRNSGEIPEHRKPKVSWAMEINPGLVGPKARPKGVVDGHTVNIP